MVASSRREERSSLASRDLPIPAGPSTVPQSPQNFCPSGFSWPQLGHLSTELLQQSSHPGRRDDVAFLFVKHQRFPKECLGLLSPSRPESGDACVLDRAGTQALAWRVLCCLRGKRYPLG